MKANLEILGSELINEKDVDCLSLMIDNQTVIKYRSLGSSKAFM